MTGEGAEEDMGEIQADMVVAGGAGEVVAIETGLEAPQGDNMQIAPYSI